MASPLILSLEKQNSFYGSKIKILSPAKINLYFNIIGKYSEGFHRIESIVERVSLCDEISIEVTRNRQIRIFSNDKSLENENNLCVKAAGLLNKEFNISFGYDISLNKKIPVGAGLGGGSSNAASILIGLNKLLNLQLTLKQLYRLGSQLGSDVNFFLSQERFAFIYGKGECVAPFKGKTFKHFIIWPKINLSTKEVYDNTRVKLTNFLRNVKMLQYALGKGDRFLIKKGIFNVLEKSACSLCSKLRRIKTALNDKGIFAKVTGSGSSLYTIMDGASPQKIDKFLFKDSLVFEVQTF